MSTQSKNSDQPAPKPTSRPVIPNLPSKTGNKSGGGRGNYPPSKGK